MTYISCEYQCHFKRTFSHASSAIYRTCGLSYPVLPPPPFPPTCPRHTQKLTYLLAKVVKNVRAQSFSTTRPTPRHAFHHLHSCQLFCVFSEEDDRDAIQTQSCTSVFALTSSLLQPEPRATVATEMRLPFGDDGSTYSRHASSTPLGNARRSYIWTRQRQKELYGLENDSARHGQPPSIASRSISSRSCVGQPSEKTFPFLSRLETTLTQSVHKKRRTRLLAELSPPPMKFCITPPRKPLSTNTQTDLSPTILQRRWSVNMDRSE